MTLYYKFPALRWKQKICISELKSANSCAATFPAVQATCHQNEQLHVLWRIHRCYSLCFYLPRHCTTLIKISPINHVYGQPFTEGQSQNSKSNVYGGIKFPLVLYQECSFHNVNIACWRILGMPLEAQVLTCSREDSTGCGVICICDSLLQSAD